MKLRSAALLSTSLLLPSAGCSLLVDSSGLEGGHPGTEASDSARGVDGGDGAAADASDAPESPSDAGAEAGDTPGALDAASGDTAPRCPALHGGPMLDVVAVDGTHYCIDATEVTQQDYATFLTDPARDATPQPAACAANTSYVPADCPAGTYDPTGKPRFPVACVDWCDAHAYCAWAGKRLCGKIGGGPIAPGAPSTSSQWVSACARGDARVYPYGMTYQPTTCASADHGPTPVIVGSLPGCVGGFDGLFDMSGNVYEWIDSCNTGADGGLGACQARGGSYAADTVLGTDSKHHLACDPSDVLHPPGDSHFDDVGFRCCAD